MNDSFSSNIFDRFIERLDDDRLIFLAEDIRALSAYRFEIDDELAGKSWNFLDKTTRLYKTRLIQADSTIRVMLQKPFDFKVSEIMSLNPDSQRFSPSMKEYAIRWHQWLKYETMIRIYDGFSLDSMKSNPSQKSFTLSEEEARTKVQNIELRRIKSIIDNPVGFDNYLANLFCTIIATNFDPHTEFFSMGGREEFLNEIHPDGMYYGFAIGEDEKGDLQITNLIPGGPAWKTGELNKGDEVLQMAFENKAPVDLTGASADEASALIDMAGNEKLTLTIKKPGGLVRSVTLVKEKIRNDDHIVKSYVLQSEKKIGYISLPGFYADAEAEHVASCANDVAKEIINLKKDHIDGLILDLRNNGGGSLREALDMAGIFIDLGPLAMYREKDEKTITLKDMNQGTIYDGPLLLLQNGQSASASELLAAVLQDYHRAIIAGSLSYGKGTAQTILPLDTLYNPDSDSSNPQNSELGFVKITTGKFYRITGSTTQQVGVRPDIPMPDMLDDLKFREIYEPFSLTPDSVKKNNYYKALTALPIEALAGKSETRIKNNAGFIAVKSFSKKLAGENNGPGEVPLQWDDFLLWTKKYKRIDPGELEKRIQAVHPGFVVDNNSVERNSIYANNYDLEVNMNWKKRLAEDIYIAEAVQVLTDYINLIPTK